MTFTCEYLKQFSKKIMLNAGLNEKEATIFADNLIEADMRGVSSHGITRLKTYAERVTKGVVATNVVPFIENDSPSFLRVNGKNGMGAPVGIQVMDFCIERAKKTGACFASVSHGNHFGCASFYSMYAADRNMIGFAMCNSDASVVPTGGTKPMLGTNPLSVSIPAKRHPHLVLDMATSVVARGKVFLAEKEGRSIPKDWGVDSQGVPTDIPSKILNGGSMLPVGGPKGYAIGLIIDIICSVLTGSNNGRTIPSFFFDFEHEQNNGFFFGAMNIEHIIPLNIFYDRMDAVLGEFKSVPPAPGVKEVMIPGEIEYNKTQECKMKGIEISETIVKELIDLGEFYRVPFGAATKK